VNLDSCCLQAPLPRGDAAPVERWRLLDPTAAMNGVLLFGWSAAVNFEVMRRAVRSRDQEDEPSSRASV
jgi:hypothetical protein